MCYQLESESALDPSNETDLFCLHHIFLPLLNKSLSEFVAAHNNHKVSTEENKTPVQIFLGSQHLTEIHTDHRNEIPYQGLDVNTLLGEDLPYVECDDTEIPLDDETMVELQNTINIFSSTDPMELYRQTVQLVGQLICIIIIQYMYVNTTFKKNEQIININSYLKKCSSFIAFVCVK